MIETLDITNFRCFDRISLRGLTRVNVITGQNSSGKSALLEAMYIAGNGTAVSIQNIAANRGQVPTLGLAPGLNFLIGGLPQTITVASFFDPLFREHLSEPAESGDRVIEKERRISFSYTDNEHTKYALTIAYQTAQDTTPVPVPVLRGIGARGDFPAILTQEKTPPIGVPERRALPVTIAPTGQLQQPVSSPFGPVTLIFGANMDYAEQDTVTWFSQLTTRNESRKLIEWVRKEFPFICGLEVLAPSTPTASIFAVMPDGARRRLSSVSSGLYKIITILAAATHTRDGIILIDEIENGIFYEKYPAVWRIIYDFAKATGNQVFVTSHSAECLAALPDVIGDNSKDFCLLRAERENGACIVRHISGVAMRAALRGKNEVRGVTHGFDSDNRPLSPTH